MGSGGVTWCVQRCLPAPGLFLWGQTREEVRRDTNNNPWQGGPGKFLVTHLLRSVILVLNRQPGFMLFFFLVETLKVFQISQAVI